MIDKHECSHGGIHLTDATLHHHHVMSPYLATVELKSTHAALFTVLQQRQEQIQFLAHCHDDSYLHI